MRRTMIAVSTLLATLGAPAASADRSFSCDEVHGDLWYHCRGAIRGRAHLLDELRTGTGDLRESARWAGLLNFQEAAAPLRTLVQNPPEHDAPWVLGAFAEALAELDDHEAAPLLVDQARRMEDEAYQVWEETIRALRLLGGTETLDYARDLFGRLDDPTSVWAENAVPALLPIALAADARDLLPTLVEWTTTHGEAMNEFLYAELMGARIRLGDEDLLRQARLDLGTPDARVPARPEFYVGALGADPADIPSLLRMASSTSPESRLAYDAIDRFAAWLAAEEGIVPEGRAGDRRRRELTQARERLTAGLRELTDDREDRDDIQFEARMLARHHASLARLGDESARGRLVELIGDDVETVIPWVAAEHAVALGLDGAAEAVRELVVRGTRQGNPTERWEARQDFLDAVAPVFGANDASWTVMLLDTNTNTRVRAIHHLARLLPPGACEAVAGAVKGADDDAVEDALVALTVLGDACTARLERLARYAKAPEVARLMAVETLAMLRAPAAEELIRLLRPQTELDLYLERAERTLVAPD